jgi:putative ABC transport system permease protein
MEWRRWIFAVRARRRALVQRRRTENDLHDELSFHLAMQTRANVQSGLSNAEAGRRARAALGGVEQTKERSRDMRPLRWADDFMQDLRYAQRSLRRAPGFTSVAVITLALGIGANTALFSVISAVLLRPLPYPDAERLVRVWTTQPPESGVPRIGSALPDYRVWRSENRTFEDLGAFHFVTYNVTGSDRPERLPATRMTASLWPVLQHQPLHGRVFSAADEQWGAHQVVVLGEGLWRRRFGGDPQVIGRSLQLNGQPFTVIGVMPASFGFPGPQIEMWSPIAFPPGSNLDSRNNYFVELLGRLKPGVTTDEALADLSRIADRLKREFPENAGKGVTLQEWRELIVGGIRPTLLFLLGAVAFVLLIASANVANLLLARATTRAHELTVRATIGAGRGRLVRQLLTEHLVLASLGAIAGVLLASAVIRGIPALGPTGVPRLTEATMDGRVVGFAAALALLTGLICGIWPARHAGRIGGVGRLNESARSVAGGRMRARVRQALVAAEVSLSLVLLVGAMLLIVSLHRVLRVDPGFDADGLFTATLTLPAVRYGDADRIARFVQNAVDEVAALPGIRAAGATTALPLGQNEWSKYFGIDGRTAPASLAEVPSVYYRQVAPGYFRAMSATLRRGRWFTEQDGPGQPLVAIVNETLARRFWPNQDPIGGRISLHQPESLAPPETFPQPDGSTRFPRRTVVGVISDFRQNGPEREANPEVFVPFAQHGGDYLDTFFLVARTAGDPLAATAAIQAAVVGLDRNLPVANVRTMERRLSDSMAQRRFVMLLLGGFGMLALTLALVGLYGVMAYTVSQRRGELGVRAALGATAGELLRLVMVDGLRMTAIGVGIGLLLAAGLSRLLSAQLFQVEAIDPVVYAGVTALFVVVACLACGVPAFRAARVDPATALRHE